MLAVNCVMNDVWCVLQLTSKARVLLRQVFEHLNVVDRQYFGLRYFDDENDEDSEPVSTE